MNSVGENPVGSGIIPQLGKSNRQQVSKGIGLEKLSKGRVMRGD